MPRCSFTRRLISSIRAVRLSLPRTALSARLQNYLGQRPKCPLLFHFGSKDPNTPPDLIEKVRQTFPAAETYMYEAGHAFANDARPSYVAAASDTARTRTLAFLSKVHQAAAAA